MFEVSVFTSHIPPLHSIIATESAEKFVIGIDPVKVVGKAFIYSLRKESLSQTLLATGASPSPYTYPLLTSMALSSIRL